MFGCPIRCFLAVTDMPLRTAILFVAASAFQFALIIIGIQIYLKLVEKTIKLYSKLFLLCMIGLSGDIALDFLNVVEGKFEPEARTVHYCKLGKIRVT